MEKQIEEMIRQAAMGLYNLAATVESHRRAQPNIIYHWRFDSLTPEQQKPWLHNAEMAARDQPVVGMTETAPADGED